DADFAKFNERKERMDLMQSQYQQMKMQLESYQQLQADAENSARTQRLRIQALEAQLAQAQTSHRKHHNKHIAGFEAAEMTAQKTAILEANKRLKDENNDLKDELEELRAMIEILKAQHSGIKGLVASPRASPVHFASPLHPEP
ncbi:hypothetical protein H0H93_004299, partial [Arthromyces matolae]